MQQPKRSPPRRSGHFSFGASGTWGLWRTQHTKLNFNGIVTIIVKPTPAAYLKEPAHCALFAIGLFGAPLLSIYPVVVASVGHYEHTAMLVMHVVLAEHLLT